MEIRPATTQDTEAVLALYRLLFAEMAALQPEAFERADQDRAFVKGAIRSDHADVLLATNEGVAAGFAMVRCCMTPDYPAVKTRRYAHLMDLAVLPPYRKRGMGTALLGAVRQWAVDRACSYVELCVLEENQTARRLYEHAGFASKVRTMRAPL